MKNILNEEGYVEISPYEKDSYDYKLAYAKKESIRTHKWIEAEKGRNLTWNDAKEEWLRLYEKQFERGFSKNYNTFNIIGLKRFPLEYFMFGVIGLSYFLILYMSK